MRVIRIIKSPSDITIPQGMTRKIKFGVLHCTAGPQNQTTEEIFKYWQSAHGWKTAGYHYDIGVDGTIEQLVEIDQVANGVAGHNANSIHFCYKGGLDAHGHGVDNRTEAQKASQLMIIHRLKQLFPNIVFLGHRDFSLDKNGDGILESWEWIKFCPGFDVRDWLSQEGLDKAVEPEKIVYKLNNPIIKNDTVKAIQTALKLTVDGLFGQHTSDAVKAFQTRLKLTADGIVGPTTAASLEALIPLSSGYKGLLAQIKNK